ncbi:hypothetical protein AHAS_Ahas02G0094500 [Arachis hypogaea]
MSALFNFHSFLTVILLGICACTYFKMQFPAVLEQRTGFRGFFWKAARIVVFFVYAMEMTGAERRFVNPSTILTYQTIVSCTCTFLPLNKKDMDSSGAIKPVGIRRLLYDGCFNNLLLSYIVPLVSGSSILCSSAVLYAE